MNYEQAVKLLPETTKNVMVVLSGGLDSSSVAIMLANYYGKDRVYAVSFNYGQKQVKELEKAQELSRLLGISHEILDLSILGKIAKPVSANISGTSISMPNIKEVLGEPQPVTYVPNRNMIMYSLAAAQAEVTGCEYIFCGLQIHDLYGYFDTSAEWVNRMNNVLNLNRKHQIKIIAPFSQLSKFEEIKIIEELDKLHLLNYTLTCYNPNENGESCGKCPSCAERIASFAKVGIKDPIKYSIDIPWDKMINV